MKILKKKFLYTALGIALIFLFQKSSATKFATFHLIDKTSRREVHPLTNNGKISLAKNLAIEVRINNLSIDKLQFEPNCGISSIANEQKPFRLNLDSFELSNNLSCEIAMNGWSNLWNWQGKEILLLNFLRSVNSDNTKTFHVAKGKIYDANGKIFIPKNGMQSKAKKASRFR